MAICDSINAIDIVVLISGRGSNMRALCEAAEREDSVFRVVAVVSNNAEAKGLEIAENFDLPTHVIKKGSQGEVELSNIISRDYKSMNFICLAGFMRILSPKFVKRWQDKIINIHPSLHLKHKGLDTHRRAIEAGDKQHGACVHYVTAEVDEGEIIDEIEVPILPDDTPEILADRVLAKEHILYSHAINELAKGILADPHKQFKVSRLSELPARGSRPRGGHSDAETPVKLRA